MPMLSEIFRGCRNRAIRRDMYKSGYKLFEVDLLLHHLRELGVRCLAFDPNYSICGKTPGLVGGPDVVIPPSPPAQQHGPVAIWICGLHHRLRRKMTPEVGDWMTYLRAAGWECVIGFLADDVIVDLVRLGYERRAEKREREPMKDAV